MAEKIPPDKERFSALEGVDLPIEYLLNEKRETLRRGRAMGIGESGFMIMTEDPLSLGAHLHLRLYIPKVLSSASNWQAIPAEAKVVWVDDMPAPDRFRRYGTLITKMSEGDTASLKNYIYLTRRLKDKIQNQ